MHQSRFQFTIPRSDSMQLIQAIMITKDILKVSESGGGERLRQARQTLGLTQQQLADKAGTNQAVIQKIENGHSIRPRVLVELGVALEVNPAWLQFGDLCAAKGLPEEEKIE